MSTADKSMIRQCLFNSTLREIREIEDIDYSFIEASPSFKERIKSSIEATPRKRKFYPKKLIVALVAVISMCFLIMFAVSAQVRTKVVDFFVEIYESFTMLFVKEASTDDNPVKIETEYEPCYMRENGYELFSKSSGKISVLAVWKKHDLSLRFSQNIVKNSDYVFDTEDTLYEIKYIGDQKVYYKIKHDVITVKWLEYGYSFSLNCNESLGWDEIEKIILSLEPT